MGDGFSSEVVIWQHLEVAKGWSLYMANSGLRQNISSSWRVCTFDLPEYA